MKRFLYRAAIAAAAIFVFSAGPSSAAEEPAGERVLPVYGGSSYVKTIYNEQNGLPTGEANTVLQTSDGYIWIGSYGGLIRYDGNSFRNYSTDGSVSSSSIRSLYEDSAGRLWIGTNDAGVYLYEEGKFTDIKSPGDYSFLCIRDFAEGPDGRIYIASTSGMGEIKDGAIEVYSDDDLAGQTVYSIACDPLGRVWAAMNSGRCALVSGQKPVRILESSEIFSDAEIYCVASGRDGKLYVGSSADELAVLTFDEQGNFTSRVCSTGKIVTHNSIVTTDDGTIVVCGEHGFAVLDSAGKILMYDDTDQAMPVNTGTLDYEGNLWLASSTYGVIKYTAGSIEALGQDTEIRGLAVNAVTKAGGAFYAVHDNGLSIVTQSGSAVSNELTEMLAGVRIRHVMTDSRGMVWLSTYSEHGAICYDPEDGSMTEYNTEAGMLSNLVRTVIELQDGSFAAATQEGVNIIRDGRVTESYNADNGLSVSAILCFAQDEDGTLYMGSDGGGVYALKDGKIANYGYEEDLEEGVVLRMLPDSDSDGYFISAGSNLYYWDKTRFRKLENFLKGAGSIFDFVDYDGKLWLLQNNGIIALDKARLLSGEFTNEKKYSFAQGLTGSLNANTWNYLDGDGTLYLSTRSGISVFRFSGTDMPLPRISINSVSIDGETYEQSETLQIPRGAQRVTIDFAALAYSGNLDFSISYMLKGFDDKETVLNNTGSGSISYTNIPGGEYDFVVKVYDSDHPETEQICTMHLEKQKRLYEYSLFWVLLVAAVVLLAIAVTYIIAAVRLRAARRRQQEYQRIVDQSLRTFAQIIDAKDKYTNGHSLRVAAYSRELSRRMGMPKQEQERIYYIALLHDIGKIGVPDSILTKPGKLTEEEMDIVRTHPAVGGKILENFTAIQGISQGARYHHERYDGTGYCEKKAGTDIPLEARIIGVADTYDAMSSTRCYRAALTKEAIEAELRKVSGSQLDPEIVRHMLDMIEEGVVPAETVPIAESGNV